MDWMYLVRQPVYHIPCIPRPGRRKKLIHDCAALSDQLNEISRFFVSVGPVVSGIERAHLLYEAKEHLKQSFFHEYGFILDKDTVMSLPSPSRRSCCWSSPWPWPKSRRQAVLSWQDSFTVHCAK